MVQVYTDKPCKTLKANAFLAYAFHIVLINFIKSLLCVRSDLGHTFVGLFSVCTATDERDE